MLGVERTEIGIACGKCDRFSLRSIERCPECGNDLAVQPAGQSFQAISAAQAVPKAGSQEPTIGARSIAASAGVESVQRSGERPKEQQMDQARYYVCESCMTPVPSGHKFCGRCGAPVPETMLHQPVDFYSDMQDPTRARLILIRGEGMDGLSYHLKADEHVVGRQGQVEFPDDPFVSPRHANFFYRDNRLVVRDEGSLNGVFFRIRGSVEIVPGDLFLVGEQIFRLDPTPKASDGADGDGTFFYSSPKYPSAFRLNQVLEGGSIGMTVCARGNTLQVGREDGDINFPADVYMSARHATVEERDGKYFLTDLDSRNGTYVRLKAERSLVHGDYVFIGRRLLRVEMNSN
jgi:pSer/pThr/pTyr-binding forkhead associated (FHA) protein/RNA polymerase subunit RPABC4/transcription elongation factor Spt4